VREEEGGGNTTRGKQISVGRGGSTNAASGEMGWSNATAGVDSSARMRKVSKEEERGGRRAAWTS
jgi:hypothetical protein